tara:strand:- start:54 stop:635 length:582 start_codon:yes stop_codon:yes gene_type:complete
MNQLFKQMESAFEEKIQDGVYKLKSGDLKSVAAISRKIQSQEEKLERLNEEYKQAKRDLLALTDQELPALMQEIGLSKVELSDGSKVSVKPIYSGNITAANQEAAFGWLRENNFGDIIKNEVKAAFGAGEDEAAASFIKAAAEIGVETTEKQGVHHSTLRAWIKERVESGDDFPTELFGAFIGQRAKIERGSK